jgi:hypothetical protein
MISVSGQGGQMSEKTYVNAGTIRWITEIRDGGATLVLDDGSQWRLDESDAHAGLDWKKTALVMVEARKAPAAGHVLSAADDRRIAVEYLGLASWTGEPVPSGEGRSRSGTPDPSTTSADG